MAHVVMYTTPVCPYCTKAKRLLVKKGVSFEEIDISSNLAVRDEMIEKTGGRRSVPQILINDHAIGGCDDLYDLENAGKLDALLKG